MDLNSILKEASAKMARAVEHTMHEFSTLHTGKASPTMVEGISVQVEAYGGATMNIKELAAVMTPDTRLIQIQPFDKGVLRDIERAIQKANLGFNPSIEGQSIRIPIPELSKERRKDLAKIANNMAEDGRVRVRHCRREALDVVKVAQKDGVVSEDDAKRFDKDIQTATDKWVKEIDSHLAHKEKELLTV